MDAASAEGAAVFFDAGASYDIEGAPLTFLWDFGDGGSASGPAPSHVYADQGAYIVTLTVSDGLAFATDTLVITVSNGAPVRLTLFRPYRKLPPPQFG